MSTTSVDTPRPPAVRADAAAQQPPDGRELTVVIEPRHGWQLLNWQELWQYRDLYFFLVWRGVKVRYAQSAIGIGWAVIQPLFTMLVFSVVFGTLAGVSSDGVPYKLFSLAALVPWTYFQNALTQGAQSLVTNANMISKVYFPRLILPLAAVAGKLVDFAIAMCVLALLMAWFHFSAGSPDVTGDTAPPAPASLSSGLAAAGECLRGGIDAAAVEEHWRFVPTLRLLALPLLTGLMVLTAAGLGAWLTALAVQYRDVQYAMTFVVQLLMYAAPVVYPTSAVPERYEFMGRTINLQLLYALNPLVGVIEGFRSALLGTREMPWALIGIGTLSAIVIAFTGCLYFRSRERLFADVA